MLVEWPRMARAKVESGEWETYRKYDTDSPTDMQWLHDVAAKRASFVESSGLPPARASFMSLLKGDCSLSLRDAVLHEGRPNIFSLIGEPPFLGDVVGLEEDDESSDEVEQQ